MNAVTCLGAFYHFLARPALSQCEDENSLNNAPAGKVQKLFRCTQENVFSPCLFALQGRSETLSLPSHEGGEHMPVSKVAILRCGHVISVLLSAIDGTSRAQMLPQLKVEALNTLTHLTYCLCIGQKTQEAGGTRFFLWQFIPGICSRLVRVLATILKRNARTGGASRVIVAVVCTLSTMLQVFPSVQIYLAYWPGFLIFLGKWPVRFGI